MGMQCPARREQKGGMIGNQLLDFLQEQLRRFVVLVVGKEGFHIGIASIVG